MVISGTFRKVLFYEINFAVKKERFEFVLRDWPKAADKS